MPTKGVKLGLATRALAKTLAWQARRKIFSKTRLPFHLCMIVMIGKCMFSWCYSAKAWDIGRSWKV